MSYRNYLSIGLVTLCACTWVNENEQGKNVAIRSSDTIHGCTLKGKISAQVKSKVGFYQRNKEKVLSELHVLARNEAVKLGANTITAIGEPGAGRQTYKAYQC